jgi:hypothetical protein
MLKILYNIYFLNFNHPVIDSYHTRLWIRLSNYLLAGNYTVTGRFTKKRKLPEKQSGDQKLVVSLTTFPERIENVWLVIESLLAQSHKPDAILLWLSSGEFDGKVSLPKKLMLQEERGLQIRFCEDNLLPHKKYFYTMQEYPEANVVTVDDDVIYHPTLVEKLMECHRLYPSSICGTLLRKIEVNRNRVLPYNEWSYLRTNSEPKFENQMIGVGGVLYPANSLHSDVFDKDSLRKFSLYTDDLWLKVMSLKKGTRIAGISGEFPRLFMPLVITKTGRLADENIGNNKNDKSFQRLIEYYNISVTDFKKRGSREPAS